MKFVFIVIALLLPIACANTTSADRLDNNAARATPTVELANHSLNVNSFAPLQEESEKIDKAEREKIEAQNEKFEVVPDEFKNIDFQKLTYSYKFSYDHKKFAFSFNGQDQHDYDFEDYQGWFAFGTVFYVDLTGDVKPEAIVLLTHVSCGGSCDGGTALIYIYSNLNSIPNQLWQFETGSPGYGLGLKSFRVKDKKIIIEEFDKCSDKESKANPGCNSKFAAKNVIRLVFGFNGKTFVQKSKETIITPPSDVKNYPSEISINN